MARQPAHRPSRRDDIVDAAITVFADKGYAEASISDIAEVAEVAVTAVYYHFTGKDDLFAAAMRKALNAISEVVLAVRPQNGTADADDLRRAIDAVWDWIDSNPSAATLVHIQLPGAIRQQSGIRQEFLELHERRSFDYLEDDEPLRARRSGPALAAATLRMRTLIDSLMAVHAMRLADGPLSAASSQTLRTETQRLARNLLIYPVG